jgi:glycosyltransferase involved in cell wall biosynthesis
MKRKLKILMVDKYYFIKGGAERYYFELKKVLESKGHEVIPFSMDHPDNFDSEFSDSFVNNIEFNEQSRLKKIINIPRISGRIIYSTSAKKRIKKLIDEVKPDVAHLHMIDHQLSPSILHALKEYELPVLQTVHQYKLICPNYRLFNNSTKTICEKCLNWKYFYPIITNCHKTRFSGALLALEMYIHKLMKIYEKNIDLFHTPSDFMKEKLSQNGIDAEKISKLYYTINLDDYPFSPTYEDYFIYMGRLSEEKGVLTLLQSMKKIKKGKLLILGDGPIKSELEQYAEQNNLSNVLFLGNKTGKKLKSIIQKSQFVVVPSEWYDNSPLVIYESCSFGKPVIGARIGGIPELVNHEINGLLFDPGNVEMLEEQIMRLLENPKEVKTFGKNGRKKAEQEFHPDIHYNQISNIYENLLS